MGLPWALQYAVSQSMQASMRQHQARAHAALMSDSSGMTLEALSSQMQLTLSLPVLPGSVRPARQRASTLQQSRYSAHFEC